jgi:uncharacterized protein YxeA
MARIRRLIWARGETMPLAIVLMVINVAFIVHAAKTGRFNPWGDVRRAPKYVRKAQAQWISIAEKQLRA